MSTTNTTLSDDEIVNIAADWGINIIGVIGDYPNEEYKCIKFARAIEQLVAQEVRKQALEDAAMICETECGRNDGYTCAEEIRAFANSDPVQPNHGATRSRSNQMTQQTDAPAQLLQDLSDEADICRNEGATDIADLLDRAIAELNRRALTQTVTDWKALAFATLGVVRDKMHPANVEAVQAFLRGEYDAQPVQSIPAGWQPIDTAPKDNNYRLFYKNGLVQTAKWLGDGKGFGGNGWAYDFPQNIAKGLKEQPTHWMEMPVAPQPAQEKTE